MSSHSFYTGPLRFSRDPVEVFIGNEITAFDLGSARVFGAQVDFRRKQLLGTDDSLRFGASQAYFREKVTFTSDFFDTRQISQFWYGCAFEKKIEVGGDNFYPNYIRGNTSVVFNFCSFNDGVNLSRSTFKGAVLFTNCELDGKLDLSWCNFENADLYITGNTLPDSLDLNNSNFSKELDLARTFLAKDKEVCYLNLYKVALSKVRLQYRNFKLYFPDSVYYKYEFYDAVSSTYETLLANFKEQGFRASHEKLDIEYLDWQKQFNGLLWIDDLWWRYGYEKWRILLYSAGFILLFSAFNSIWYAKVQGVYPIQKLSWPEVPWHPNVGVNIMRRHFSTFIYTGVIFFRFNIDLKNMKFFPLRYSILIMTEYTIGLVCTGFIINWILG